MVRPLVLAQSKKLLLNLTIDGISAYDVLEKGLDGLMDLCDVVEEKFTVARDQFMQKDAS